MKRNPTHVSMTLTTIVLLVLQMRQESEKYGILGNYQFSYASSEVFMNSGHVKDFSIVDVDYRKLSPCGCLSVRLLLRPFVMLELISVKGFNMLRL